MGGNDISELPASIAELVALRILHWYHRPTLSLPSVDKLSIQPTLDPYREQPLTRIYEGLTKLQQLEYVDLSHHGLAQLPTNLYQLKRLKVLALGGNRLTTFPDFIGKLGNLQLLQLSDNPMQQIPHKIWKKLAKLEYLGLANTGISKLPADIRYLKLLSYLDLATNQFTILPEFLYGMGKRMNFVEYLRHKMGCLPKYGLQNDWSKGQVRFMSHELAQVLKYNLSSESYRLDHVALKGNPIKKDEVVQQPHVSNTFLGW